MPFRGPLGDPQDGGDQLAFAFGVVDADFVFGEVEAIRLNGERSESGFPKDCRGAAIRIEGSLGGPVVGCKGRHIDFHMRA